MNDTRARRPRGAPRRRKPRAASSQAQVPTPPLVHPPIRLHRREERRLRSGHLWVFSNEIDTEATPLKDFAPGDAVSVVAANGRFVGNGYVNPHSLIAVRLLSSRAAVALTRELLRERVARAVAMRANWLNSPRYARLIHGEADGLPGLVVDRYGDVLVGQLTTAGMERRVEDLEALLREETGATTLYWANDIAVRDLEQLPRENRLAFGELPEHITVAEGEVQFDVSPGAGQKTGWYYDQRANRERLRSFIRPHHRVLDVFSYVGAWGVTCAVAGAAEVICVDSSRPALERAAMNAERNGVTLATRQGDAASVLKAMVQEEQRFDVVILDPPALIPRRKDVEAGTRAYWQLNELALRLLGDDALLVSCSCSHHLSEDSLTGIVAGAARHQQRDVQVLVRGEQSPDHPVHPAIEQTRYLKALFCRITRGPAASAGRQDGTVQSPP